MINILVPIDFSPLSKVALKYAIQFANKIDANITVINVLTLAETRHHDLRTRFQQLEKELLNATKKDLDELVEKVSPLSKTAHPIVTRIGRGYSFNETIKKEAKKLRSDLIVMGTRGASGLKKYVMGSNTASVIEVSEIPVLVIPENPEFKNFKNVVYATDLRHTAKELKALLPYLKPFDSMVHLVHVTSSLKEVSTLEKKIETILSKFDYKKVIFRVMVNKNVDEAIAHYVSTSKAELLTTFTHQHGFYDKLFDRSVTRKLAFQSKVPLLAFKQG